MSKNTFYALYAVEVDVGEAFTGTSGQYYHSFLAFIDETAGHPTKIIDEINFVAVEDAESKTEHLIAHPFRYWKDGQDFERDYHALRLLSGSEEYMRSVWQKAQHNSKQIENLALKFNRANNAPTAFNCRAAIKALIESLGLTYQPVLDTEHAQAGTQSNITHLLPTAELETI